MSDSNIFPQSYFVPDTVQSDYVDTNHDPLRRVYTQYRNKPSFVTWIQVCTTLGTDLYQTALQLRKSYDVDTVSTELLNIIGRVVVMPRGYLSPVDLTPPMVAAAENEPWEVGEDSQQLSALSSDQDTSMSDDFYRLGIKAKIVKNNTDVTIENLLSGVSFLLPDADVKRVVDNEDMTFSIEYAGTITDLELYVFSNSSVIPTPQGVKFTGFIKVNI